MVLVEEGITTEEDLVQRYGPTFTTSRDNAFQAVKTIRIVCNLLCHMQGSVKGLSQPSFECLWGLASEALSDLANALGGNHPVRLAARCAELLGSLGERQRGQQRGVRVLCHSHGVCSGARRNRDLGRGKGACVF